MRLRILSVILTLLCSRIPAAEVPHCSGDTSSARTGSVRFDFYDYQYPGPDGGLSGSGRSLMPFEGLLPGGEKSPDDTTAGNPPQETDKGETDKGGTDKGEIDKGGTDKGETDKGGTDKGGTDKGGTDKGETDKGGTDSPGTGAGDQDGEHHPLRKYAAILALLALLCYAFHILFVRSGGKIFPRQHGTAPEIPGTKPGPAPVEPPAPAQSPGTDSSADTSRQEDIDRSACSMASDMNGWSIVGASVIGNGHISSGLPCQDSCLYEDLGDGWGIAITSDGAGSAERSELGSKLVTTRGLKHFKSLVLKKGWKESGVLPSDAEWTSSSYDAIKTVRDDIMAFAATKGIDWHSLYATMIVVIHTPAGLLAAHVGDGRCGYRSSSGEWLSLMTPHKGEEANQTIFVVSEFWDLHNYVMSGVLVPESRVIREKVTAFVLMSDGCESTSWLCNQYDASTGRYYDPNLPYDKFFNAVSDSLLEMHRSGVPDQERKTGWSRFLTSNGKFAKEQDDKTMLMGVLNPQMP